MALRIPTVLEAILEATAIEQAAKARITGLRAVLETEARRRFAEEGAAPTWKARNAGAVRFDAPGDWSATVTDPDTFGSYVAERHPEEATAVLRLKVTDLPDALTALGFVGIEHDGARVEVRPGFAAKYLADLTVDVEETPTDDGTVERTIRVIDPGTGELVDGVSAQQSNAAGKLVVTLDSDRRRAVLAKAKTEAEALVAQALGQPAPAPVEPGREVGLEELIASGRVRPASSLVDSVEDQDAGYVALEEPTTLVEDEDGAPLPARFQTPAAPAEGHRIPYVGEGADGARRSAEIDRSEADGYAATSPERGACLASAERWEQQARDLEDDGLPVGPVGKAHHDTRAGDASALDGYSRERLRKVARAKGINPGGTKPQLATRLVEAGITTADVEALA